MNTKYLHKTFSKKYHAKIIHPNLTNTYIVLKGTVPTNYHKTIPKT